MRSIRFNLSSLRPVRFLLAACVCALLMFSYASPAYSGAPVNPTASPTTPREGEANLLDIERAAQEAVLKDPYSMKETQSKAQEKGTNEIQGSADLDKMKRPENAQASSVEEKLKNVLEKATGKQ